jgi:hypothetical protein
MSARVRSRSARRPARALPPARAPPPVSTASSRPHTRARESHPAACGRCARLAPSVPVDKAGGHPPCTPPGSGACTLHLLQQIPAHRFAIEVESCGDSRHTPPLLLQFSYVHKFLQSEHRVPSQERNRGRPPRKRIWLDDLPRLGNFQPALLGNFQSAFLGNFQSAFLGNFTSALTGLGDNHLLQESTECWQRNQLKRV